MKRYGLTTAQVNLVLMGDAIGERRVIIVTNQKRRQQILKQYPELKPHHVVLPRLRLTKKELEVVYIDDAIDDEAMEFAMSEYMKYGAESE